MEKVNVLVGQSGGPTVAINATLAGVIRGAMRSEAVAEVYGMLNGIEGLLKRRIINLRRSMTDAESFVRLAATPAMALGSCRYKLPPLPADGSGQREQAARHIYEQIRTIFKEYGIGCFFYIGGNDSMDTVKQLSAYFAEVGEDIRCVGVPKTIDNDLPVTDHTPGFGSAAKYVATSIAEVARDSSVYDMFSVIVFEIMGRNAGWLAAATALARDTGCPAPQLIYLPEAPFDPDALVQKVKEYSAKNQLLVIAVSEGIRLENGEYVSAAGATKDAFGHVQLAGTAKYLEELIRDKVGCKVRSVEFSVLQRAASHYASATDIEESLRIGEGAVDCALDGGTGVMMVLRRLPGEVYLTAVDCVDIGECANLEKTVPAEWITPDGCDVTDEMMAYLRPLVAGRAPHFEKNGMPEFLELDKTLVTK